MAGYSKRSLTDKLGIKEGASIFLLHAPKDYLKILGKLPKNARIAQRSDAPFSFIHAFYVRRKDFEQEFTNCKQLLLPDGMFWVSWPKGSSKVETDLNENIIRDIGVEKGLVDVKVCAVDEVWSGLKFVYRLKDR
jgi:hypothetical protein